MIEPVIRSRSAGILLHPTSLPGPFGIGDVGPAAFAWVDALARARQGLWQVLPLGPTGYGDSPYQCFSAFAGNPLLVSPMVLVREGLLAASDLPSEGEAARRVDFEQVIPRKGGLLARAWERFQGGAAPGLRAAFEAFCEAEASWLDDHALFMALKEAHGGAPWTGWDPELRAREPGPLARARERLADAIGLQRFGQFLFFRQWHALREHAGARGVRIVGDAPIFVAHDSTDLWAHPELFRLDARGLPEVVAGVPPDYFSATGQLWGNPLYDWEALARSGHRWWIDRLRSARRLVDVLRLDHFIGFERYWEVPAGSPTARTGRWVPGPGAALFDAMAAELGELPIIAEDLGLVTPEVEALRLRYGFPGMRVLQFAFAGAVEERFLPHRYDRNTVVYTGTHDNDTTRGWFAAAAPRERRHLERYLGRAVREEDASWELMRLAWASVADHAVAPLQDVLSLGSEARMNTPGTATGNWAWRVLPDQLPDALLDRLGEMTETYGREPPPTPSRPRR
jgi:4-alpha-glucanotransferase